MNVLGLLGGVNNLIDKLVPDPSAKRQIQAELRKASLEVDKERVSALKGMMGSSSLFISGGIPALIWIGAISLFSNFVLAPWTALAGVEIPTVTLPEQYWTLLGWIITGLFAKKSFDNNEIHLGGKLFKPSKDAVETDAIERRVTNIVTANGGKPASLAAARQEITQAAPVIPAPTPTPAEEKTDEYYERRWQELTKDK